MGAETKAKRRGTSLPASTNAPSCTCNAVGQDCLTDIMNVLRAGEYLKVAFVALAAGWR
jgi:hypothetical protein